jgi:phosphoribosylglycinamide formyltransferase-1
MMALVKAAQGPNYPADITLVISNRPKAKGLERASAAGISTLSIDHKDYPSRAAFEDALDKALRSYDIEFVACAGFMRVLTDGFVNQWAGRLINIHPSLLPKYKGLNTHARAIAAGDAHGGASVHWVVAEVDGGDVIAQDKVSIAPGETVESLAEKVLIRELELYPKALAQAVNAVTRDN